MIPSISGQTLTTNGVQLLSLKSSTESKKDAPDVSQVDICCDTTHCLLRK